MWKDDLMQANQNNAFALIWRNNEDTLVLQFDTTEGLQSWGTDSDLSDTKRSDRTIGDEVGK